LLKVGNMPESRDAWAKLDILAKVLTPVMLFGLGTLYSHYQNKAAGAQKAQDRVATLVKSLYSEKPEERLTAIYLLKREKEKHPGEVPDEILASAVPALVNIAINDRNAQVSEQAKKLVDDVTVSADPALAKAVDDKVAQIQARVYIHIRDEAQRGLARQIEVILEGRGVIVPGIERVAKSPSDNELRYFRTAEEGDAKRIAGLVQDAGLIEVRAKYVPGHENSKAMRLRHFELWLG
jgi:hypothetical protein